jgi:hypothetical protein
MPWSADFHDPPTADRRPDDVVSVDQRIPGVAAHHAALLRALRPGGSAAAWPVLADVTRPSATGRGVDDEIADALDRLVAAGLPDREGEDLVLRARGSEA